MAKYSAKTGGLGERIMVYRKENDLTQADLAERYGVSGPAIFKFEKGFVTPSLKLWQKIAANIGIPEKEAVLIWVREKLPTRMQKLVAEHVALDVETLESDLSGLEGGAKGVEAMRKALQSNPNISPALKRFADDTEIWGILKPTAQELVFLAQISADMNLTDMTQFRDLMLVAREIQNPGA